MIDPQQSGAASLTKQSIESSRADSPERNLAASDSSASRSIKGRHSNESSLAAVITRGQQNQQRAGKAPPVSSVNFASTGTKQQATKEQEMLMRRAEQRRRPPTTLQQLHSEHTWLQGRPTRVAGSARVCAEEHNAGPALSRRSLPIN